MRESQVKPLLLYHGSNIVIEEPSLSFSRSTLDFGRGFYMTTDPEQAKRWAERIARVRGAGVPTVSVFQTEETLWSKLRILRFDRPDEAWLDLVVACRTGRPVSEPADVITGPIADDRTVTVINQLIDGVFPKKIALQLLEPMKLSDQWAIRTEKALAALRFEGVVR